MKTLLTVTISLLFSNLLFSQNFVDIESSSNSNKSNRVNSGNNNLYLEGSLVIQSINYETKLYRSNLFQLNARLGFGYFNLFDEYESLGGLAGLTFLLGRNNNHFETSLGVFVGSYFDANGLEGYPIITIGYKYQKPEGGFIFRSNIGTLGIGVGLGYAF
jgi:hypothetical protein